MKQYYYKKNVNCPEFEFYLHIVWFKMAVKVIFSNIEASVFIDKQFGFIFVGLSVNFRR